MLALLAAAATTMTLGPAAGNPGTISRAGNAKTALTHLQQSTIGAGALTPIEILAPRGQAAGLAHALSRLPDVQGATAPAAASWHYRGSAVVDVFTHHNDNATLAKVESTAHAYGSAIRVGGIDAQNRDFISAVYGNFPVVIALLAVLAFLLLARAFRSLLLPAKAVLLNVLSIAAAWGALTLIWQHGYGSQALWGIPAAGSIPSWLPLIVFAFLFGLSMDYEVFILARIREEYDATGSTDTAVIGGIARTGRLVTCAALILFLALVSMSTASSTLVKMMRPGSAPGSSSTPPSSALSSSRPPSPSSAAGTGHSPPQPHACCKSRQHRQTALPPRQLTRLADEKACQVMLNGEREASRRPGMPSAS